MSSATINYGIHLGTAEAMIARCVGSEVEVIRNAEGSEATPSAVLIDKKGKLFVGRVAKEWHEREPDNAFIEFMRDIGEPIERTCTRSGRKLKPEDLSAEVLKSLRADVERRSGEAITAAVITVPADFDLPQCEATKRAAGLAGFQHSLLLQEPVAAAMAYGFASEEDGTTWLVYDLGPGTFDAALLQVRDGLIQVVGHTGDNQLGSRNFVWAVVEQVFMPALTKEHPLSGFGRGNRQWAAPIAKLRIQAEAAITRLAMSESTEIVIDFLCNDDRGNPVEFYHELERTDVERLVEPFLSRTVRLCQELVASLRLSMNAINKAVLVGEATLNPIVRGVLCNLVIGLGLPLDFSVDPVTVLVRGAAVFAACQPMPEFPSREQSQRGRFNVKLDYAPVSPDTEPPLAGAVSAPEGATVDFSDFTIEFINPDIRPPWRSGKISLGPKGNFITTVSAEKGNANTFQIELRDPTGALQEVDPKTLFITVKPPHPSWTALPLSIGLALPNNEVLVLLEKGVALPARRRISFYVGGLNGPSWDPAVGLRIPVVEGNRSRADRNRLVGTLIISAEKINRGVPMGSEIEVTVEVDESRLIRTKVFIPALDEEFEAVLKLESTVPDAKQLAERLHRAKERLKATRKKAESTNDSKASDAIQRIDGECMVPEAERQVSAAADDPDAARQCQNRLNSLDSALDEAEDALRWPTLADEAMRALNAVRELLESTSCATTACKQQFAVLEPETREAVRLKFPDLLRQRLDCLAALATNLGAHRLILTMQQVSEDGLAHIEGRIAGPIEKLSRGLAVELVNEDIEPEWSSGRLPLPADGRFSATVQLNAERSTNEFRVALCDGAEQKKRLVPNYFVLSISKLGPSLSAKADQRLKLVSKP
jgi:molecular chaperone DnaK